MRGAKFNTLMEDRVTICVIRALQGRYTFVAIITSIHIIEESGTVSVACALELVTLHKTDRHAFAVVWIRY